MLLLALALAGSTSAISSDTVDQVCRPALAVSLMEKSTDVSPDALERSYERYIGRMEIQITKLKLSDRDAAVVRVLCDAYQRGSGQALDTMKALFAEQSNVARRVR